MLETIIVDKVNDRKGDDGDVVLLFRPPRRRRCRRRVLSAFSKMMVQLLLLVGFAFFFTAGTSSAAAFHTASSSFALRQQRSSIELLHPFRSPASGLCRRPARQNRIVLRRSNIIVVTTLSNDGNNESSSSSASSSSPPPSQIESIVKNAKSLFERKSTKIKNTFWASSAAGLAVALSMVPEAIAFSFVANVSPLVGLWTTVTLGFTAASLGGRAGICSSASGACSVVVASLCASHGPPYLAACAVLAGIFQIVGGFMNLGKFIRLVPHPVMLGFVNGLAVLMTKSQLVHFKGISPTSKVGLASYGVAAVTMVLVKLMPKITSVVPPTLGAVAVATVASNVLKLPVDTLSDLAGASTFAGGWQVLPKFGLPSVPFTLDTFKVVLPYAVIMAAVGTIESLLTMQLVDGVMDDGKRGSTSKEMIGQGSGNVVSGLFGGIGGCALLGLSMINVQSGGGISRWSGMSMGLFLALGIVVAAPLLASVPIASLVGVMLLVCYSTFSWSSLRLVNKIPALDAFVIALVSIVTVQRDLAQAVLVGTVASALGFAWKQSTQLRAYSRTTTNNNGTAGEEVEKKVYQLHGPLFFGSTLQFQSQFEPKTDPKKVVLDFSNCRVMDHSALEAIHTLVDQYGSRNKTVVLRHLSKDCTQLLDKMTFVGRRPYEIVEEDPLTDPVYGIAEDPILYESISAS